MINLIDYCKNADLSKYNNKLEFVYHVTNYESALEILNTKVLKSNSIKNINNKVFREINPKVVCLSAVKYPTSFFGTITFSFNFKTLFEHDSKLYWIEFVQKGANWYNETNSFLITKNEVQNSTKLSNFKSLLCFKGDSLYLNQSQNDRIELLFDGDIFIDKVDRILFVERDGFKQKKIFINQKCKFIYDYQLDWLKFLSIIINNKIKLKTGLITQCELEDYVRILFRLIDKCVNFHDNGNSDYDKTFIELINQIIKNDKKTQKVLTVNNMYKLNTYIIKFLKAYFNCEFNPSDDIYEDYLVMPKDINK